MNENTDLYRYRRTEPPENPPCPPGDLMRLPGTQIGPASKLLAKAFNNSPVLVRLFSDPSRRSKLLPLVFNFLVRYGLLAGGVHITSSKLEGIAIWLRSDKIRLNPPKLLRVAVSSLPILKVGKALSGLLQYDKYATQMRQHLVPAMHWYFYTLAVAPEFQHKGYAGALIKPMLAHIDRQNLPCYLETQEADNVPIYQHYGFKIVHESTIPNLGLRHWAMLRG